MNETKQEILKVGTVLHEKWVILEFIARGGMGEVYRAHQLNLKRDVAIKIISDELLQTIKEDDEEIEIARSRFRREVKAMARIRHPNVVQIFDYGSVSIKKGGEDVLLEYIIMEYIPGSTLWFTMSEEGFYPEEDLVKEWIEAYFLPILKGVEALHNAGIIHRDLKPGNFLLDGDVPKLTDFGLARSAQLEPVTQSADMKGTPLYMPQEQFMDFRRADHRADIYALGKILFEVVEGKMPANTIPFRRAKLTKAETPFFRALDRIIQDATAEDKERRHESVEKFRSTLQEAVSRSHVKDVSQDAASDRPTPALAHYKWIWAGIAVAVFSVAAMTLWHILGNPWERQEGAKKPGTTIENPATPATSEPAGVAPTLSGSLPESITGKDGLTMRFVPGGMLKAQPAPGTGQEGEVQVAPFYLDETKVTLHHFAEFLNSVKDTLSVEGGLVKRDDEIWFLLGEGIEEHDQIIYQHGRFHLRDPKKAAQPVVRVTWYGASAYARHFGERLPTEYEWEFAAQNNRIGNQTDLDKKSKGKQSTGEETRFTPGNVSREMTQMMKEMIKDTTAPNGSGLKDMKNDIKEWAIWIRNGQEIGKQTTEAQEQIRYSSLIVGKSLQTNDMTLLRLTRSFRYPWEGFFDVGFRCVLSARSKN